MAQHKARVTGPFEVCGKKPGQAVVIDDEQVNLPALLAAGHVALTPEPKPEPKTKKGED